MAAAKSKCVFGPVLSRRLGMSLGVDLLPFKTCSMDCVYCECGGTSELTMERAEYYPTAQVLKEIDEALASGVKIDFITFSGAGEPTLHSGIGAVIGHVKARHPSCKICLLTNSTLLPDPAVAREVSGVDLIVPSLDGSNDEEFQRITRPAKGLKVEDMVEGIASFRKLSKAAMWLEIFIVPGVNDSLESAERFRALVARIAPDKVQLNSLDRPGTEAWVGVPPPETLAAMAKTISAVAPVEVVGHAQRARRQPPCPSAEEFNRRVLDLLMRRPCTAEDVSAAMGIGEGMAESHLRRMVKAGLLSEEEGQRGPFFRPAASESQSSK